jgi:hypothetical protein
MASFGLMIVTVLLFPSVVQTAFAQPVSLPMSNLRLRYIAPLANNDTMSLYLYLVDSTQWCMTSLQVEFDTTTRRPQHSFDFGFGDIFSNDVCLTPDRRLSFTNWRNNIKLGDTIFAGQFDNTFQTLEGTLRLKGQTPRIIQLRKDPFYVDTDGHKVDSLLKSFQMALSRDDKGLVADYFDYPFSLHISHLSPHNIESTRTRKIKTKAQLLRNYKSIFTRQVKEALFTLYGPMWYGGEATCEEPVISHGRRWDQSGVSIYAGIDNTRHPELAIDAINLSRY